MPSLKGAGNLFAGASWACQALFSGDNRTLLDTIRLFRIEMCARHRVCHMRAALTYGKTEYDASTWNELCTRGKMTHGKPKLVALLLLPVPVSILHATPFPVQSPNDLSVSTTRLTIVMLILCHRFFSFWFMGYITDTHAASTRANNHHAVAMRANVAHVARWIVPRHSVNNGALPPV